VIYLDSAAVVKLIHVEDGTAELLRWLGNSSGVPVVSSSLAEVEVARALRRNAPAALVSMPLVLARLVRIEMDAVVRATAAAFQEPLLRSLDAIHLATALTLAGDGGLQSFVTYDKRLLAAAADNGLPVASPGSG
jgi:predicted nucleic acid-binding protein